MPRERKSYDIRMIKKYRILERPSIKGPRDAVNHAIKIGMFKKDPDKEVFYAYYLSTKNEIIVVDTISIGSLNASIVHPREILKPAILNSAAAILMMHNHPTGDPAPSKEDIEFTRRFNQCCELIGIQLLDHVIVGADGKYHSCKENGSI